MAEFEIPQGYPNILLVYGSDVHIRSSDGGFEVNTVGLQSYFSGNPANSPVSRFSHDFWIAHPVEATGAYFDPDRVIHEEDPERPGSFRDFRGIVKMGHDLNSLDTAKASDYFWVFLQEVGHYWLVPNDLTFDGRALTDGLRFSEAFMNRGSYPELQLLGRDNSHWSSHIENNTSPMDGIGWQARETYTTEGSRADPNILRKYVGPTGWANSINLPGVGEAGYAGFSDLDKVIMGAMRKEDAFASEGNGFYELIPQWVASANMHAGLVLVFDEAHVVTFGFLGGITKIGISQTGTAYEENWDISSFYKPWEFASRIVFRVVRKDNDYYFQARQEIGNVGCLGSILRTLRLYTPPPAIDPFEDAGTPSAPVSNPADLQRWTTLKVITSATAPLGVGYGCKTWGPEAWVDMNFKPLMVKTGDTVLTPVSTDPATISTINSSYSRSLNNSRFVFHQPTSNPRLTGDANSCYLTMNGNGDNWTGVDNMPKLLVRAPQGNFIAAGSVQVFRSTLAPWAAGAYGNVELWAYRRKIQMSGLRLNPNLDYRRQDPGRPYKTAFMLVASRRSSITDEMIANLDKLRIAAEPVFSTATGSARRLDTRLR